ncbi:methyltransferase [Micromonospora parva]|uniref:methyltransferase n=1 Tax=Micromonospora parva TaxID=1464048 RepID=UPI0033E75ADF
MSVKTSQNSFLTTTSTPPRLDMSGLSAILFGHAAFEYLNAACELGLFELLHDTGELTKPEIAAKLGLEERAGDILMLGCTALGLTVKTAEKYTNAAPITALIDDGDWQRFKDTVAFEQYIVYDGQRELTESLRRNTNVGLARFPGTGRNLYHRLGEDSRLEGVFYRYMRSWSELANQCLVEALDLTNASQLLDCGGGDAVNAIALASANPHVRITIFEMPHAAEIAKRRIAERNLSDRVLVTTGDMFEDAFPAGNDVILFAHQFVIWTLEENTTLLRKAYEALPPGGRVVIFNSMSNDSGDGPLVAALDSVYFATLPEEGGMIYSWSQHEQCLADAGFRNVQRHAWSGWTPHGVIIATK